MTVSFCTLGCKVNQYESEALAELFQKRGYTVSDDDSAADIIIVNSCTVTAESSRKTRQSVRKLRRRNPDALLVLTGCMAQAFPEEARALTEVDLVIGNSRYDELPELCEEFMRSRAHSLIVEPHAADERFTGLTVKKFAGHTRSYIKIEDGCNRFCSYCIIPYARGRVRSKPVETIAAEAEALARAGYKETVLVGINLSAFGQDVGAELCDAVEAAAGADGIERVRLGSLECDQIADSALDRLARCEKFCPQFHLSLQSGCDRTLKDMNRKYDTAFYRDFVARIRSRFQNPSITTDIMVGFPGETDEDFRASCDFVSEMGFARSHVFIYSARSGTAAAKRSDRVPGEIAQQRSAAMLRTCAAAERRFLASQVGRVSKVLFETCENGFWEGYTENYTKVRTKSPEIREGDILDIKITGVHDDYCTGEIEKSGKI